MNVRVNGIRHAGEEVARGRSLWLWCPGCDGAHRVQVTGEDGSRPDGPVWEWDGNVEAPTVSPSILVTYDVTDRPELKLDRRCHSHLKAGRWEFLPDCTHPLAGQTVPMVPLPDWLANEEVAQ